MSTTLTYNDVKELVEPLRGYGRRSLVPANDPSFEIAEGGGIVVRLGDTEHEHERETIVVTKEMWAALAGDLGAGGRYFDNTPPRLLLPQINWWYGDPSASGPQSDVLVRPNPDGSLRGLDILRAGKTPVDAVQVLDIIHGTLSDMGGEPQYKYFDRQGVRECTIAAVQPQDAAEVTTSRHVGDILEAGALVRFSPIGAIPVTVMAYSNRLICTNGMTVTDTRDVWKAPGGEGLNDPYEWMPEAILAAWDGNAQIVQSANRMAATEVPEDAVETLVTDAFHNFRVPQSLRHRVIEQLANQNVESAWDIMNAITFAGTHFEGLRPQDRVRLWSFGGDLAGHFEQCPECHHLLTVEHR